MEYTDIIAREADSLPPENKVQVLDFIEYLKERQSRAGGASASRTPEEIEVLFRSINVDTRGYTFDRKDANAR